MEDEMEMTKDELKLWIAERVRAMGLNDSETVDNCNQLQDLIDRFQSQVSLFLDLCQSVNDFESKVKTLYASLGLEYTDVDSEDDSDDQSGSGDVFSKLSLQASVSVSPKKEDQVDFQNIVAINPVVILTRLPEWKIDEYVKPKAPTLKASTATTATTTTTNNNSNVDDYNSDLENVDSDDALWQPEGEEECDSEYESRSSKKRKVLLWLSEDDENLSDFEIKKSSRKKKIMKKKKHSAPPKSPPPQQQQQPPPKQKPPPPQPQPQPQQQQPAQTPAAPPVSAPAQSTTNKTTKGEGVMPVYMVTTLCQSSDANSKVPRAVPHKDITVNMALLAQKSSMSWEKAEVQGLVEKDQGLIKYKVLFGDKKKTLISPHHIALDIVPEPEHLYVGARVVVGGLRAAVYRPGIVAEIPSRKNHLRFLVFIDNRTTVYVSLTFIRLVYKPLQDPLDDIRNASHKEFVKEYIQFWPCPPQIQYSIGQPLKVERDGEMQKCEVLRTDCSMVQVKYENDEQTEWLYRGSLRLDHMANLKKKWIEKSWSHKKNPPANHRNMCHGYNSSTVMSHHHHHRHHRPSRMGLDSKEELQSILNKMRLGFKR